MVGMKQEEGIQHLAPDVVNRAFESGWVISKIRRNISNIIFVSSDALQCGMRAKTGQSGVSILSRQVSSQKGYFLGIICGCTCCRNDTRFQYAIKLYVNI